ncbi:hypothetical protein DIPPA_33032 [Diplonema papillatum]|nr:hypothetical protein DIPPA_33032 [Diplonema papillatum]
MPLYPERHWTRVSEKIIQCDVCPNFCKLKEGKRGRCFVRGNEGGRMALYTDGRTSGAQVDPIEKKPLNHFLPATRVLSFGTIGCNLSCKFCQNWHITRSKDEGALRQEVTPQRVAQAALDLRCDSIAFTYNDPVIFMEFAAQVAQHARPLGIKTVAVTAGYMCPEPADEFLTSLDALNVDLKAFSQNFYGKICNAKLQPVLDTLVRIKEAGKWLEITNLVIPGHNDDMVEIKEMSKWIKENLGPDVPLHFTAFHPDSQMLDVPRTPASTLSTAREVAKSEGLRHVYTGNVHDPSCQSTYCSQCDALLVERDWHRAVPTPLLKMLPGETAACGGCGTIVPGVFALSRYQGDVSISRPIPVRL